MFHHSVLQVLPPLLALLCVGEDVCGGAVGRALSQLLPIILHQGGPAHQLHGGELLQKVPENENGWPGVRRFYSPTRQRWNGDNGANLTCIWGFLPVSCLCWFSARGPTARCRTAREWRTAQRSSGPEAQRWRDVTAKDGLIVLLLATMFLN